MRPILRGVLFGLAALAAALVIDLAVSGTSHFGKFRLALHGASFTMTAIGAAAGFALLRGRAIDKRHAAMLGAGTGVIAFVAVGAAVRMGAFTAIAVSLVAGSAVIAYLGGRAVAA